MAQETAQKQTLTSTSCMDLMTTLHSWPLSFQGLLEDGSMRMISLSPGVSFLSTCSRRTTAF